MCVAVHPPRGSPCVLVSCAASWPLHDQGVGGLLHVAGARASFAAAPLCGMEPPSPLRPRVMPPVPLCPPCPGISATCPWWTRRPSSALESSRAWTCCTFWCPSPGAPPRGAACTTTCSCCRVDAGPVPVVVPPPQGQLLPGLALVARPGQCPQRSWPHRLRGPLPSSRGRGVCAEGVSCGCMYVVGSMR